MSSLAIKTLETVELQFLWTPLSGVFQRASQIMTGKQPGSTQSFHTAQNCLQVKLPVIVLI